MKKLPKSLYAKIESPANDEPYLLAAPDMECLNIEIGDKVKIGLYKLVGTYNAEGMVETSKFRSSKHD